MTRLWNDPSSFTEDAMVGFLDANAQYVVGVPGGVVRASATRPGKVAVIVGGGSGHYPAFCGVVGPGFADGAVVGNVFTSPSAADAASVGRAADGGAGVLFSTGDYADDVMNLNQAVERLAEEGIEARHVLVTDDTASAAPRTTRSGLASRRLHVFKVASTAAEAGYDLDAVQRAAVHANDRTRTLGVAFDGCTMPGPMSRCSRSTPAGWDGGWASMGSPALPTTRSRVPPSSLHCSSKGSSRTLPRERARGSLPSSTDWAAPSTKRFSSSGARPAGCSARRGSRLSSRRSVSSSPASTWPAAR